MKRSAPHLLSVFLSRREVISGLCFLPFYFVLLPLLVSIACSMSGLASAAYAQNFLFYLIAALAVAILFRGFLLQNLRSFLASPVRNALAAVLFTALHYLISWLVSLLVSALDSDFVNANNTALLTVFEGHTLLLVLVSCLLAPLLEECLFRGLIFSTLVQSSRIAGYAAAVLCFSAVHIAVYIGELTPLQLLLSLLQYAPPAFLLCLCYEKTDSLFSSMLMHALINLIACIALLAG